MVLQMGQGLRDIKTGPRNIQVTPEHLQSDGLDHWRPIPHLKMGSALERNEWNFQKKLGSALAGINPVSTSQSLK